MNTQQERVGKELSKLVAGDVVRVHQEDGTSETATVVRVVLFPIVESARGLVYKVTYTNDVTGAQGSHVGLGDDLVAMARACAEEASR